MNCATKIIDEKLGGTRAAASMLGCPVSTVQSWKDVGRIPASRQADVIRIAREYGVDISPNDFFPADISEPLAESAA